MFLTALLRGARSVGGRQWSGKHRKAKKVTRHSLRNARMRKQMVDSNDRILARPFLVQSEESNFSTRRYENILGTAPLQNSFP
eukprot:m.7661 g.7661  ORF g.7661 m.7661 type:complete len:83 (+) comp19339_c0_seq2:93-341(+)